MSPVKRDRRVVDAVRSERSRKGLLRCEVCGWGPPQRLRDIGLDLDKMALVHAHHVVPLEFGGADAVENLVLLCPNHHAIAHRLGDGRSRSGKTRYWNGPRSREALIHELKLLHSSDRAAWDLWIENGRDWERHACDEEIRAGRTFTIVRGGAA